jgi:hypothetical protein
VARSLLSSPVSVAVLFGALLTIGHRSPAWRLSAERPLYLWHPDCGLFTGYAASSARKSFYRERPLALSFSAGMSGQACAPLETVPTVIGAMSASAESKAAAHARRTTGSR